MFFFFLSILFIISSFSFWSMWLGMEMFNFFFIPWLSEGVSVNKSSKIFLYFVIQVIASGIFLISSMNHSSFFFFCLLISSMIIKLGSFPFHLWVLMIIENMDWKKFSIFMTISKLGPMSVLFFINPLVELTKPLWMGVLSPIWGLKSISIRKMMTFSSIAHMSWIIVCMILSKSLLLFYLVSYWMIFFSSCLLFNNYLVSTVKDIFHFSFSLFQIVIILMLMGFPPFFGFFPKLFTLKLMCNNNMFFSSLFMSVMSIIPMFFYLKMMISMYFTYSFKNISFIFMNFNKKNIFLSLTLILLSMEILLFL